MGSSGKREIFNRNWNYRSNPANEKKKKVTSSSLTAIKELTNRNAQV